MTTPITSAQAAQQTFSQPVTDSHQTPSKEKKNSPDVMAAVPGMLAGEAAGTAFVVIGAFATPLAGPVLAAGGIFCVITGSIYGIWNMMSTNKTSTLDQVSQAAQKIEKVAQVDIPNNIKETNKLVLKVNNCTNEVRNIIVEAKEERQKQKEDTKQFEQQVTPIGEKFEGYTEKLREYSVQFSEGAQKIEKTIEKLDYREKYNQEKEKNTRLKKKLESTKKTIQAFTESFLPSAKKNEIPESKSKEKQCFIPSQNNIIPYIKLK